MDRSSADHQETGNRPPRVKQSAAVHPPAGFRIHPWRRFVQGVFLLLTLWIGVQFALFVGQLERGTVPTVIRPPGVESFLPISSLINLKYWLVGGEFTMIHPAGTILLLVILATGLLLKKGFCSWVCPVGLISETLARLNRFIFGKPVRVPIWLDLPLRSLKYLLLLFFLHAVLLGMDADLLSRFINSPYNKVADIKMLHFFTRMSETTFWVLVVLVLFSTMIPFFWCRYLCPYGALLGGLSWLSPLKIHRNRKTCIDCRQCTKVCPAAIRVHKKRTVLSDECHACLECVQSCPVDDTLYLSTGRTRGKVHPLLFGGTVVLLFLLGTAVGRTLGIWQNEITIEEYQHHITRLDDPVYSHNRGQVPDTETHGLNTNEKVR